MTVLSTHQSRTSLPDFIAQHPAAMFLLVVAGTLFDVVHKGSATYFFENLRRSKSKAARRVGGGELASIAVQTAVVDVLASGEFCNPRRRVAHLLGMYGFVFYVLATVVLVFNASASPIWSCAAISSGEVSSPTVTTRGAAKIIEVDVNGPPRSFSSINRAYFIYSHTAVSADRLTAHTPKTRRNLPTGFHNSRTRKVFSETLARTRTKVFLIVFSHEQWALMVK